MRVLEFAGQIPLCFSQWLLNTAGLRPQLLSLPGGARSKIIIALFIQIIRFRFSNFDYWRLVLSHRVVSIVINFVEVILHLLWTFLLRAGSCCTTTFPGRKLRIYRAYIIYNQYTIYTKIRVIAMTYLPWSNEKPSSILLILSAYLP